MRIVLHVLRIAIPSSLVANPVFAHAFGRPYDLPIPLSLYLAGAGVVVALSFVIAVFAFRVVAPTLDATERFRLIPWVSAWQAISVAVFLLVIAAGLLGAQRTFKNIAPLTVWVIGWAGLSLVCGFIGDVWVILNPWAAVHTWAERLARSIRLPLSLNLPLPMWLGSWPALGLFFGFAWCELLWDGSGHPHDIANLLIRYSVFTWIGMVLFGRTVWLRTGEALSVAFGLFGCFAPVSLRCVDGGRIGIGLRPFGIGLLHDLPYTVSRTAFLILMLATVTFDGLSETPVWLALLRLFQSIGGDAITIATAGLVLLPVIFGGAFVATVWFCRQLAQDRQPLIMLACTFAPTLLPIALAYQLAHNLSFLLLGMQYMVPLLSDPFGLGWDLFGTRLYLIDPSVVSAKLLWTVAIIAIVLGHVAAVFLSHVVALRVFTYRASYSNQVPMLALMVTYTMTSLWILAQPITNARAGG